MNDIEIADLEIATQLEEGLNEVNPVRLRIKSQFFEDMCQSLNPKQNKIEMRAIFRHQLDEVIRLLHTEDRLHKSYYHFYNNYKVVKSEPYQLVDIKDNGKVVICLEEMFDVCMEIHKKVGYTGRSAMEPMANQFYANITRKIIEIFLKYSKEYQLKRKKVCLFLNFFSQIFFIN